MAWDGSNRKARLPHDWARLRIRVLRRARYACQHREDDGRRCMAPANQVDHIVAGDDHRLDNLQALCTWHHARKSAREGVAARGPRPTLRRDPEPHPLTRRALAVPALGVDSLPPALSSLGSA